LRCRLNASSAITSCPFHRTFVTLPTRTVPPYVPCHAMPCHAMPCQAFASLLDQSGQKPGNRNHTPYVSVCTHGRVGLIHSSTDNTGLASPALSCPINALLCFALLCFPGRSRNSSALVLRQTASENDPPINQHNGKERSRFENPQDYNEIMPRALIQRRHCIL
jgi:hypothetical protein